MKNRFIAALWIILSLHSFHSLAQTKGSVNGYVRNGETEQAVTDAEISLLPEGRGTVSDARGYYSIKDISPGKYTLQITHISYETHAREITIKEGQSLNLSFSLVKKVTELTEVEILESAKRRIPYVKMEIQRAEIEKTAGRDVGEMLRQTPNVSGIRKGGTALDPVVRGFKFSQLNTQIDNGQKIEGGCPNRMDPAVAHVEIEEIDRIEVYKGPYALRFGPVMGGVVNMVTSKPFSYDKFTTEVKAMKGYESNWNGDKEYLLVRGGDKKYFFQLEGGNKEYGDYKDGNGNPVRASFHRYNYKAQVGVKPFDGHTLMLSWGQSKGRNVDYVSLPMDERNDDTELWSLDYLFVQSGKKFNALDIKLYRSDVKHEMDNFERPFSDTVAAVSLVDAVNSGLRAETGWHLGSGRLFAGLDFEHIYKDGTRTKYAITQPLLPVFVEQLWNNAVITNLGVFGEYKLIKSKFDFITALRIDMNQANSDDITIKRMESVIYSSTDNESDYVNFSISAGAIRKISDQLSLAFTLGRGVRSPDMVERYVTLLPVGYDRYDYIGNPALKPEANHEADLTLKYQHQRAGSMELNGFYSYVTDYITGELVPSSVVKPLTKGALGVKKFVNTEVATFTGFEFSYASPAVYKLQGRLTAAYTYGVAKEATKQVLNASNQVVDEETIPNDALTEIPPFEANIRVSYKLFSDKLEPFLGLRLVADQGHVSEAYYEKETPGFTVVNLGLSYTLNKYLFVAGGVNNLFDAAYFEHLNRNILESSADFYEPGRIFYVNLIFNVSSR